MGPDVVFAVEPEFELHPDMSATTVAAVVSVMTKRLRCPIGPPDHDKRLPGK
jgi:hypothetical protein